MLYVLHCVRMYTVVATYEGSRRLELGCLQLNIVLVFVSHGLHHEIRRFWLRKLTFVIECID